jgi:hypothetical protein
MFLQTLSAVAIVVLNVLQDAHNPSVERQPCVEHHAPSMGECGYRQRCREQEKYRGKRQQLNPTDEQIYHER